MDAFCLWMLSKVLCRRHGLYCRKLCRLVWNLSLLWIRWISQIAVPKKCTRWCSTWCSAWMQPRTSWISPLSTVLPRIIGWVPTGSSRLITFIRFWTVSWRIFLPPNSWRVHRKCWLLRWIILRIPGVLLWAAYTVAYWKKAWMCLWQSVTGVSWNQKSRNCIHSKVWAV